MLRSVAIARIKRGLGFRTGTGLDETIALTLQEAQIDLESGKTLPKLLLREEQTLALAASAHTVALPSGFIRINDDTDLRYYPTSSDRPTFLQRKFFKEAVLAQVDEDDETGPPEIYVLRKSTIDFITVADRAYTLYWDYYKSADALTSDIENAWLADTTGGAQWLIGEAGHRVAMDLRDKDAVSLFASMTQKGRAACFGETLAAELEDEPMTMGADS